MYQQTTGVKKIQALRKRIRAIGGGTAASKTIGALLVLIDLAQSDPIPTITTIISESMPHLKKGAMRDFLDIMNKHGYYHEGQWNRTDSIYTFKSGSIIEFVGLDTPDKAAGPRRDRAFLNECNHMSLEIFNQVEVRTREFIILDWNPTNEFWFYTDVLPSRTEDVDFITLTYKDNEALEPSIVKAIESRKGNKNWWDVYGLGKLGVAEGRVYKDWQIIDEVPHEARLERYGLDFGYSNDPSAIVAIYYYNGGYILDEITFMKGLSNRQIADILTNKEPALVMADSAEPKSIDEIKSYGVNIMAVEKGKDSVNFGIQYVQDQKISVSSRSNNLIKEYRNYLWEIDRDGKQTGTPEHQFSHSMDAVRYGMSKLSGYTNTLQVIGYETGLGNTQIPVYNFGDEEL